MIVFRDVSFAYEKDDPVLEGISFTVSASEKVGLIGANGAGKSTLLKLICGLLYGEGEIMIDGMPVRKETLSQIRKKIGFVMQNSDQQMFMPTVYDDMMFAPLNYGVSREEADSMVCGVLEQLGISYLKNRYNHRISGGEKRMAAIAVILANAPEVILMDEPTSALDPANRRMIIRTIQNLEQTCLITSHDLDMILDTCSRVILLNEGHIEKDGPAYEILSDRNLLEKCHLELPLSLFDRETCRSEPV